MREEDADRRAAVALPYAGMTRIRFQGYLSAHDVDAPSVYNDSPSKVREAERICQVINMCPS